MKKCPGRGCFDTGRNSVHPPDMCARFLFLLSFLSCGWAFALPKNLMKENLVAWCIVPFDAAKRSPEDRSKMLNELGLTRCAYDWRPEHVASFEEEIQQYQKHGIEFFAFWGEHEKAFQLFEKHDLHPQIWKMFGDPQGGSQDEKVTNAVNSLEGLAKKTAAMKCKLGLYNHGGWSGEPANLVAVCQKLHEAGHTHVGIVYNWHHGHDEIAQWADSLKLMKPYLHCLNLNGMKLGAEFKILPLSQGEHELEMLRTLIASKYEGPIGILDHRQEVDSKVALQENLDGLSTLTKDEAAKK